MSAGILSKIKKILPRRLKYDYVHFRNLGEHRKEINRIDRREGEGKDYTYTLNGFEKKNCIFVHVPRAAGSSISEAVFGNLGGGHRTVKRYRAIFGRKFWSYYKFSFVRNPYTRLVSAYEYLKSGGHPAWPSNQTFRREVLEAYSGFSDFVLDWLRPDRSEWPVPHFRPQVHFLKLDSRIPLDFVGCVEEIKDDFGVISKKIENEKNLPKKNETPGDKKPIDKYFEKEEVRERVNEVYNEDFKKLGYSRSILKSGKEPDIRGKFS
jgi:hypothetical protein